MRVPVPRNRIVALTLVGAVLVAAVSVSLAFPGVLPNDDDRSGTVASDAPSPNQEFTPAVQNAGGEDGEREEHEEEGEEYEEHEED